VRRGRALQRLRGPDGILRETRTLRCRLCAKASRSRSVAATAAGIVSPLGWDPERVAAAVARRFPKLTISRTDPRAQIVIGTGAMLAHFAPGELDASASSRSTTCRAPGFRGGGVPSSSRGRRPRPWRRRPPRRATLHPALRGASGETTTARASTSPSSISAEGYPPFRRICVVSVRARGEGDARAVIDGCAETLRGLAGLTVYPAAAAGARERDGPLAIRHQGPAEPPRLIGAALTPYLERRRRGGAVEAEMIWCRDALAPPVRSSAARSDDHPKGDGSIMARLSVRLYGDPISTVAESVTVVTPRSSRSSRT
jgi:hypothetical protein